MSFSKQDIEILRKAKSEGKTKEQALSLLASSRSPSSAQQPAQKPGVFSREGVLGKAADKVVDFIGAKPLTQTYGSEIAKLGATEQQKEFISEAQPSTKETIASGLKTGSMFVGGAGAGAGMARMAAHGFAGGLMYDIGQNIEEGKEGAESFTPGATALIGSIAGPAGPVINKGGKFAKKGVDAVGRKVTESGKYITQSPVVKGALENAVELGERVPRFISKRKADLRNSATRAERIANSPAPIGKALRTGMDERIVNTIEQADGVTRGEYGKIVRLAEESIDTSGTIKMTARPEIVAGDAAAEQYKIINAQKKKIGEAIGEQVQALSKDRAIPMTQVRNELNESLGDIGISLTETPNGPVLDFSKTGFSKAQRAKINELYELATEGGTTLTPAEIHAKDRLFSQLSRESRMDGIGDILVDTGEGKTSLFRIFRDVYSDTLEGVAPEIRKLNGQYRNLSTFTEDVENSIIKSGKFESNKHIDPAEFAQTNLRRLFSEAQSAADYRAIADEMDVMSRALGYGGAKPEDLAQFAYEIRKIYPESTPRTGFEGSIKSVKDVVGQVLDAGSPDLEDQQKALRELIDYYEQL